MSLWQKFAYTFHEVKPGDRTRPVNLSETSTNSTEPTKKKQKNYFNKNKNKNK